MKFISTVFLAFALALGGLHLTSCQAFTQADAQALGAQIAKSSLEVAAKAAAGEPIDLKAAAVLIGVQAASSAIHTVATNLNDSANAPSVTPQSIVSAAHADAQDAIAAAAVPDPEIAAKAAEIATQAIAVAQARLGSEGVTSGN